MHNIAIEQNKDENISILKAQRQAYSDVKFFMIIAIIIGVALPFIFSWIAFILNNDWFSNKFNFTKVDIGYLSAFISIISTISIEYLGFHISNKREEAAKIQELFDTEVFNLEWDEFNVGEKPDIGIIIEKKNKFDKKHSNSQEFVNWYTQEAANYSYPKSIILCHQQNLYWDNYLREKTISYSTWTLGILILLIGIFGIINDNSFRNLVTNVISFVLPIIIFYAKLRSEHIIAMSENNRLRNLNESMIRELNLSNNETTIIDKCRNFQTAIFAYRKSLRPIPNIIHNLFKNRLEEISVVRVQQTTS